GPTVTPVADEATTTGVGVETEGATTITTGLDVGLDSGNIHESPLRINNLEKELQQTKSTYGKVVLTLVERVKLLLEAALKRKSMKFLWSMEEKEADFVTPKKVSASGEAQEEDISPTTLEAAKTLSKVASQNVSTYKRRARSASKGKDIGIGMDFFSAAKERLNSAEVEVNTEVNPGSAGVNTGNTPVSTPSVIQTVNVIVPSLVKSQREGKAPMTSEDKRKAKVQEAAQFYTEEDWDTIRAKLEANAELTKSLQGENVSSDDFAKRMVDMINQKKKYYVEQKAMTKRDKPMTQA
ncbi:hypothetical protein Tco_0634490, partial [Tanacetum coccineum]